MSSREAIPNKIQTMKRPQSLYVSKDFVAQRLSEVNSVQLRSDFNRNNTYSANFTRKSSMKKKLFSLFKMHGKHSHPSNENSNTDENIRLSSNMDNSIGAEISHNSLSPVRHSSGKIGSQKFKNQFELISNEKLDLGDLNIIEKFNIHPYNLHIIKYLKESTCSLLKIPSSWIDKMGEHLSNNVVIPFLSVIPGSMGIDNHGNTCYVNVIVQCLAHIDGVAEYFACKDYIRHLNHEHIKGNTSNSTETANSLDVTIGLAYFLQSLWQNTYHSKLSLKFCHLLTMYKNEYSLDTQQDAHEFLLCALNVLHDNLMHKVTTNQSETSQTTSVNNPALDSSEKVNSVESSFIYDSFRLWLSNEIRCSDCKTSRQCYDEMFSLNLQLPKQVLESPNLSEPPWHLFYILVINSSQGVDKHAFQINKSTKVAHIRKSIADRLDCQPEDFLVLEVTEYGLGTVFQDRERMLPICEQHTYSNCCTFDSFANGLCVVYIRSQIVDVDSLPFESGSMTIGTSYKVTRPDEENSSMTLKKIDVVENLPFIRLLVVHVEKSKDCITEITDDYHRQSTVTTPSPSPPPAYGGHQTGPRLSSRSASNPPSRKPFYRFTRVMPVQASRKTTMSYLRYSLGEQMCHILNVRNLIQLPRPQIIIEGNQLLSDADQFPLSHRHISAILQEKICRYGSESSFITMTVVWPHNTTQQLRYHKRISREEISDGAKISLIKLDIKIHPSVAELTSKYHSEQRSLSTKESSYEKVNITDCLDEFFTSDSLSTIESWQCSRCGATQAARNRLSIDRAPPVLVLMLKRFGSGSKPQQPPRRCASNRSTDDCLNKLECFIDYPLHDLDMKPYIDSPDESSSYLYNLVGVVNHRGGLDNGHYVAICQNSIDNKWRLFDDDRVIEISKSDVVQPDAYILFYQRQQQSTESRKPPSTSGLHWSYRRLAFPDVLHRNQNPSPTAIYSRVHTSSPLVAVASASGSGNVNNSTSTFVHMSSWPGPCSTDSSNSSSPQQDDSGAVIPSRSSSLSTTLTTTSQLQHHHHHQSPDHDECYNSLSNSPTPEDQKSPDVHSLHN